jgi:hypothetical protein
MPSFNPLHFRVVVATSQGLDVNSHGSPGSTAQWSNSHCGKAWPPVDDLKQMCYILKTLLIRCMLMHNPVLLLYYNGPLPIIVIAFVPIKYCLLSIKQNLSHSTYGSKLKFSLSEYFNFLFAYLVITYYSLQFLSNGDMK